MDRGGGRFDLGSLLAAGEEAPPAEAAEALAGVLASAVDAHHVRLLVTNMSGTALVRLTHVGPSPEWEAGRNERTETVALAGTVYEDVLFSQRISVTPAGGGWRVLVPTTERGDALGVVELLLPTAPDAQVTEFLAGAAHAFAYALVAARRHTDIFEDAQRDIAFSVPAEMQRRLLPAAYTVEAAPVTLAGWLEPVHDVGGDTFDYSLDRDYLFVSLTDALGHSTQAALLATLTVAALRNARRRLSGVAAQADTANAELFDHTNSEQFVTGLILSVRLSDGHTEIVNAGHPPPYLLRHGHVEQFALEPGLPLGIAQDPYHTTTLELEPGDRILLVTDGYLERNAATVDIPNILVTTAGRHPRQVVRELAGLVLAATNNKLRDDATTVCFDWHGPHKHRNATHGASRTRTTPPNLET